MCYHVLPDVGSADFVDQCATVCYMTDQRPRSRVGIRELRQNLSIYIDRVKDGESLEVTEHGHPVAELTPNSTSIKVAV